MSDHPFDQIHDLRREIERLNAKLDRQSERDARLTRERAVLAAFIRHGDGKVSDVRRIIDEALGYWSRHGCSYATEEEAIASVRESITRARIAMDKAICLKVGAQ